METTFRVQCASMGTAQGAEAMMQLRLREMTNSSRIAIQIPQKRAGNGDGCGRGGRAGGAGRNTKVCRNSVANAFTSNANFTWQKVVAKRGNEERAEQTGVTVRWVCGTELWRIHKGKIMNK